ncbi:MAG: DoxX family protein [Pseudomonadota bacterium]
MTQTASTTSTSYNETTAAFGSTANGATSDVIAWTLVRLVTGLTLVPHGAQKLFGWFGGYGIEGTAGFFEQSLGLYPGVLFAVVAGLTEFVGGLLLAAGALTRLTALAAVALMGYAAFVVHWSNGFFWTDGGLEFPLMWMVIALALVIRGGGRWSADHAVGFKY